MGLPAHIGFVAEAPVKAKVRHSCPKILVTQVRLAKTKARVNTRNLRKDTVIKRFVLGEKEGNAAGAEASTFCVMIGVSICVLEEPGHLYSADRFCNRSVVLWQYDARKEGNDSSWPGRDFINNSLSVKAVVTGASREYKRTVRDDLSIIVQRMWKRAYPSGIIGTSDVWRYKKLSQKCCQLTGAFLL